MRVRLLKDLPNIHPEYKAGDVIDCNAPEAARYMQNGTATKVEEGRARPKRRAKTKAGS